ncbi:DUF397 domain-containing protein [Micromonospora sp. WMMA1363]|nr:DUF397 domain-containing protein [Micromonospora sp. WMMA1363]MDM4721305.1 DUF397 domain-containing protein [Micromonospora sp. WMMA1363]
MVRDSKDQQEPLLSFDPGGWGYAIDADKNGQFAT